jgi:hypothetical protein
VKVVIIGQGTPFDSTLLSKEFLFLLKLYICCCRSISWTWSSSWISIFSSLWSHTSSKSEEHIQVCINNNTKKTISCFCHDNELI